MRPSKAPIAPSVNPAAAPLAPKPMVGECFLNVILQLSCNRLVPKYVNESKRTVQVGMGAGVGAGAE